MKSNLLKDSRIEFIPNSLGNFMSSSMVDSRKVNHSKTIIGVASMDPNSYIKGGDFVAQLKEKFELEEIPVLFKFLNEVEMNGFSTETFWEDLDYLFVPSRIDNSPNVIHEAKIQGIPIIASAVGGIVELLNPNFDVAIPEECLNFEYLLTLLKNLPKVIDLNTKSKTIKNSFSDYIKNSIPEHIALYKSIMR
jgi:glycosyltransferase involved in cell wall biosynthesis